MATDRIDEIADEAARIITTGDGDLMGVKAQVAGAILKAQAAAEQVRTIINTDDLSGLVENIDARIQDKIECQISADEWLKISEAVCAEKIRAGEPVFLVQATEREIYGEGTDEPIDVVQMTANQIRNMALEEAAHRVGQMTDGATDDRVETLLNAAANIRALRRFKRS